jgi:colicin import membrane protein
VPVDDAKMKKQHLADALQQLKLKTASQMPPTQKPAAQKPAGSSISNAIANLQKKVALQGSGPGGRGSGAAGSGNLYGKGSGGGAFDPYKSKIADIIQKNWSFSSLMLRNTAGMEVYVAINILPDGSIREIRYERKSSSENLNNSVKMALQKSDPLPQPPRESGTMDIWVRFVFTPEGIETGQ